MAIQMMPYALKNYGSSVAALRITTRKKTLIIGYMSSSLHAALIGKTWTRGATFFSWTLAASAEQRRHTIMTLDCSNMLDTLKALDWMTIQRTIGNNHSTIIGLFASWYIHTSNDATVIEGAPSFHARRSKPFKSDGLFCEGDNVVGILEVEGSRHDHTIGKIRKHFDANLDVLGHLRFAIYVAYSESPRGRNPHRTFPSPLTDRDFGKFSKLSRDYPNKCIAVVTLEKLVDRQLSEVRKKSEYYSGHINCVSARLYQNGNVVDQFSCSAPAANSQKEDAHHGI